MFKCEHLFYRELGSKLQSLRGEANLPPLRFANSFYEDEKAGIIVLENLAPMGYHSPDASAKGMCTNTFFFTEHFFW